MPELSARKQVAVWLLACCLLVFAMVVVGGVTRLTHSGLSIVEWQPIVGTLPPTSHADWQILFGKYRQTPEFRLVNFRMDLEGFKRIFWWEYAHRLLGRLIGAAFLLPFVWFLLRRRIDARLKRPLAGIFLLGALQGALGWYMVQSGLADDPRVSQFRLTAHLGLAFAIFAAMLWVALDLLEAPQTVASRASPRLRWCALALVALLFLMVLSGGFVAGIRAGFAYNTFPLMDGHLVPPEILLLKPWHLNFFHNMATVQFNHRLIAWILALAVPAFWWMARREPISARARLACNVLLAGLAVQIALGISTLLMRVPVELAAAHQAGAVMVFAAAVWAAHEVRGGP